MKLLKFNDFVNNFILMNEGYNLLSDEDIAKMDDVNVLYQSIKKYITDRGLNISGPITVSKKGDVKIYRSLDVPDFVRYMEHEFKFSPSNAAKKIRIGRGFNVSFGNGTRSKSGVNLGNQFEDHFAMDLKKWIEEGDEAYKQMFVPDVTKEFIEKVNLSKYNVTEEDVRGEGGKNNPRPILFSGNQPYIGSQNYSETGKILTDVTITSNPPIYISCKTSSTVTFFNAGIRKIMPQIAVQTGKYSNEILSVFKMLGIDPEKFTKVFKYIETGERFGESVQVSVDSGVLKEFIKTGIGSGYWMVHKGYKGNKNSIKYIDDAFINQAANIKGPITVFYGGKKGEGIRVDVEFETDVCRFKVNLRDKQGSGGYPSHIMMDYQYI